MRTFCLIGMERSGNHAFMQWLVSRYRTRIVTQRIQPRGKLCEVVTACHSNHVMSKEARRPDIFFENYLNGNVDQDRMYTDSIFILRDPYNWLASLVSFYNFNMATCNHRFFIGQWIAHAHAITEGSQWVNYNRWCTDEGKQYYESLLDLPKVENDAVPTGRGKRSSFGKDADNKFQERYLKVLEHKDDSVIYKHILGQYPELVMYANRLFGMSTPKELEGVYAGRNDVIVAWKNRQGRGLA